MAETLLSLKSRLASIRSISKITKAMKLVSSAKYTRVRAIYDSEKRYCDDMHDCFMLCLSNVDFSKKRRPTCMTEKSGNRDLYVFVSSTLGLCGAYNYDLYKVFLDNVKAEDDVVCIGEKGLRHFRDKVHKAYDDFVSIQSHLDLESANRLRHWLDNVYRQGDYRSVRVIYTKFVNSITFKPMCERLIPIMDQDVLETMGPASPTATKPIFDPNPYKVADAIVPHYFDAVIYNKLLESLLSEQASRRNSMDSATDSANELSDRLKISYNKLRQQKITQEITEVVGGANATGGSGF